MYSAITRSIRVSVTPIFLEEQSTPEEDHYVWAYQVNIRNDGPETVQLLSRHWMITDATMIAYFANGYWPTSTPRSYTHPSGYCTLGSAMPSAVGAKIGVPYRKGIALAGDAGFLFTATELATAVDEKVALPIVVWNNDCLGQINEGMVSTATFYDPDGNAMMLAQDLTGGA